jgi:hypothetical protein
LFPVPTQSNDTDERYTPRWIFDELGYQFDLDVAAPPGGVAWIPAKFFYTAEDDGLALPWKGLVWCNPPFSLGAPFSARFIQHGYGIGIFPLSQAAWMKTLLAAVDELAIPLSIKFESPSHSGRHISFAVALVSIGISLGDYRGTRWSQS